MMKRLAAEGKLGGFLDVFQHRTVPSKVFTPPRLLSTAAGMVVRGDGDRAGVLREVRELVMADTRRKRLRKNPVFVDPAAHADAGETEVPQEAAA
jgi:hypothetical protein